jgi:hypothetical protein
MRDNAMDDTRVEGAGVDGLCATRPASSIDTLSDSS